MKIEIKPLSINESYQGMRFKTDKCIAYERNLSLMLPDIIIENRPMKVDISFGFSSPLSDIDNPVKMFVDVLQKKYSFNDKYIFEMNLKKEIVKKGSEYIDFEFEYL